MGFVLNMLATIAYWGVWPIATLFNIVDNLFGANDRNMSYALLLDKKANVKLGGLLNSLIVVVGGYLFGNYRDTISFALWKNKEFGDMKWFGHVLAWVLDYADPYHLEKSAGLQVPVVYLSFWERLKRLAVLFIIFTVFMLFLGFTIALIGGFFYLCWKYGYAVYLHITT